MKIEKDGIVKELADEFLLKDYLAAGWKQSEEKKVEEKPSRRLRFEKEDK